MKNFIKAIVTIGSLLIATPVFAAEKCVSHAMAVHDLAASAEKSHAVVHDVHLTGAKVPKFLAVIGRDGGGDEIDIFTVKGSDVALFVLYNKGCVVFVAKAPRLEVETALQEALPQA